MLKSYLKGGSRLILCALLLSSTSLVGQNDLIITAIFDGPLSGGTPKGIELYALDDISDLSEYGIGSAFNGGGSSGVDFTLSGTALAGDYIYISSEEPQFTSFFGFASTFISGSMGVNGDDAIELFKNGAVIDEFGDPDTDGTGQPWEYLDSWAARNNGSLPSASFNASDWTFGGPNVLDGESSNATAATPVPIGSFSSGSGPTCSLTDAGIGVIACSDNSTDADGSDDVLSFDLNPTGTDLGTNGYNVSVSGGSILPPSASYGAATTFTLQVGSAGAGDVVVTIEDVDNSGCSIAATVADPGACSANVVAPCFTETFENIGSSSGSYSTVSWTGDEGIDFVATDSRTDQTLNGRALTIQNGSLIATDISGGIAELTVSTQRAFTGGTGTIDIRINGSSVGTVPYDATVQTTTITGIDISGFFDLQIDCSGSDRIKIDDLMWTCFEGGPICNLLDGGLDAVTCGDGSTPEIETDDVISFNLNPTGASLGAAGYTVSVSSGAVFPTAGVYGSATNFTLQAGSAGAGDVVVTIADAVNAGCTLDVTVTDPGICSFPPPSALLFSQYVDTDSGITPKGVEIWNNTGSAIDFSSDNLVIEKGTNGGVPSTAFTLTSGILEDGGVIVIGTADMGTELEATFGAGNIQFEEKAFSFNGDDALVLKLGGVITDMIGIAGSDPGSEWAGSGVSTKDQNISLLSTIETGSATGFTDPSTRFSTTSATPSENGGLQGFGLAPNEAAYVITPTQASVVQCAEFEVLVSIANGSDLNTVETYLTFDPSLVQVESITAPGGGSLPDLSTLPQVVIPATFDNGLGTIAYAASTPTLLTNNFDLMLITFSAVAGTGTSAVDVVLSGSPVSRIATTGLVGGVFLASYLEVTAYSESISLTPDLELPFFACVSDPAENADEGTCTYTVQGNQYDPVGAEDNCGIASIINDYNNTSTLAGEILADGTVITWTVTDVNGNAGQCTFTMTVIDTQNPVAACQGITVQLDANGMASITPGQIDNGSSDNCGIETYALNVTDYTCANIGENSVTLTVTDEAGNQSTCNASVLVVDDIPPTIPVLSDVTDECSVTLVAPTTTDNCGIITGTTTDPISYSEQGSYVVNWTFEDGSGNAINVTQNVIIDDLTPPVSDVTTLPDVTAECEVSALTAPTATDNCGGVVTVSNDASFPINTQGTTIVTWTYDDGNGNTSSQAQNVVIDDVTAPVINCAPNDSRTVNQTNDTYLVSGTEFDATATDNCLGVVSISHNGASVLAPQVGPNSTSLNGWELPVGTTTITFTATDVEGNESTCTVEVTVENVEVSGTLTLNGACLPLEMTVSLYEPGTPNPAPIPAGTFAGISIDASGGFSFDALGVVPGSYDVYIKVESYLTEFVGTYTVSNSPTGIAVSGFRPGDISLDDDIINGVDLSLLIGAYNTLPGDAAYDDRADLNCDNVVDALDLSLMIFFYLDEGDSPLSE